MKATSDWQARFEIFTREKTRLATTASLPPFETDVQQAAENATGIGNAWTMRLFDGRFFLSPATDERRPSCSLVFVQSADGNTGAADPGSLGGGETDKHLIYEGLSRAAADAVMAGAETVRGADIVFSVWHPEVVRLRHSLGLPRHPIQIVVTRRGIDPDATLLCNLPELRVLLLTVSAGARKMDEGLRTRPWITPILMRGDDDLPRAFEQLRVMGIRRVSCVGGRVVARHLLDAQLVDDLYLTTSPYPGGEPGTPLLATGRPDALIVRKRGTETESGVVFEHFARHQPHDTAGYANRFT